MCMCVCVCVCVCMWTKKGYLFAQYSSYNAKNGCMTQKWEGGKENITIYDFYHNIYIYIYIYGDKNVFLKSENGSNTGQYFFSFPLYHSYATQPFFVLCKEYWVIIISCSSTHTHTHTHTYIYIYIYMIVCACIRVCIYVCLCIFMCVYGFGDVFEEVAPLSGMAREREREGGRERKRERERAIQSMLCITHAQG